MTWWQFIAAVVLQAGGVAGLTAALYEWRVVAPLRRELAAADERAERAERAAAQLRQRRQPALPRLDVPPLNVPAGLFDEVDQLIQNDGGKA